MNNKKRCLLNIYAPSPAPRKHVQRKWTDTANNPNFSESKVPNSVINCSIVPKLDLTIIMICLYTKSNSRKCNLCQDNEQGNHMIRIFICSRCKTYLRIARSFFKSNLTDRHAKFVYQFLFQYLQLLQENRRNCKLLHF